MVDSFDGIKNVDFPNVFIASRSIIIISLYHHRLCGGGGVPAACFCKRMSQPTTLTGGGPYDTYYTSGSGGGVPSFFFLLKDIQPTLLFLSATRIFSSVRFNYPPSRVCIYEILFLVANSRRVFTPYFYRDKISRCFLTISLRTIFSYYY